MPIANYREDFGRVRLYKWEEGLFNVVKIRNESRCHICDKEIKKGCYCLGVNYWKVCLGCAENFIKNFLSSLDEQKKMAKELQKSIETNRGEYNKNNLINSI